MNISLANTPSMLPKNYLVDVEICYAGYRFHHSYVTRAITDDEAHDSAFMYTQSHYRENIQSLRESHPDFDLRVHACYELDYHKSKHIGQVVPMFIPGKYLGKR